MELHQLNNFNNIPDEDSVAEVLILTCKVNNAGIKEYYNKEGQHHRIYGPARIWKHDVGTEYWKNGKYFGGTTTSLYNEKEYFCSYDKNYYCPTKVLKDEFLRYLKENGIKPIE